MRQSVRPTRHVHCQNFVVTSVETLALATDGPGKLIIAQIHRLAVKGAAKNPGLSMGRSPSGKDEIVKEYAARAKTLVTRKQTAEALQPGAVRRIETSNG